MNRQVAKNAKKYTFNSCHQDSGNPPIKEGGIPFIDLIGRIYFAVCLLSICLLASPAWGAPQPHTPSAADLNLSPEDIKNSPVLQRWLRKVPNILDEINNDASFRTRLRLGYSLFPSRDAAGGWNIGVEDVFSTLR